jgi:hypothetical protein
MTDRLGRLLLVTLEAARVNADLPVVMVLRSWLDSWRGIGAVERGMAHHEAIRRFWDIVSKVQSFDESLRLVLRRQRPGVLDVCASINTAGGGRESAA